MYGLKPTPERVTQRGEINALPNSFSSVEILKTATGPLGKCVDDLKIAF